eukprot:2991488-Pyramimonas_sp.AAC.1
MVYHHRASMKFALCACVLMLLPMAEFPSGTVKLPCSPRRLEAWSTCPLGVVEVVFAKVLSVQ